MLNEIARIQANAYENLPTALNKYSYMVYCLNSHFQKFREYEMILENNRCSTDISQSYIKSEDSNTSVNNSGSEQDTNDRHKSSKIDDLALQSLLQSIKSSAMDEIIRISGLSLDVLTLLDPSVVLRHRETIDKAEKLSSSRLSLRAQVEREAPAFGFAPYGDSSIASISNDSSLREHIRSKAYSSGVEQTVEKFDKNASTLDIDGIQTTDNNMDSTDIFNANRSKSLNSVSSHLHPNQRVLWSSLHSLKRFLDVNDAKLFDQRWVKEAAKSLLLNMSKQKVVENAESVSHQ